MTTRSLWRWMLVPAAMGAGITFVLTAVLAASPDPWHRHLETPFLFLCPPSILLMAAETCSGWLSWCMAQIALVIAGLNALLYALIGAALWLLARVLSSAKERRGDATRAISQAGPASRRHR